MGASEPSRRAPSRPCVLLVLTLAPSGVVAGGRRPTADVRRGDRDRHVRRGHRRRAAGRRSRDRVTFASRRCVRARASRPNVPGRDRRRPGRARRRSATRTRRRPAACTRTPASSSASGSRFADGRVVDSPTTTIRYEDDRFEWRTLEGPLVRIHWVRGRRRVRAAGARHRRAGGGGGHRAARRRRRPQPIDFFVYGDRDAFYDVLGPGPCRRTSAASRCRRSGPCSRTSRRPRSTTRGSGIVIPHELTHLVFDTATRNPYHEPPHWLNEGLADYLAQGYNAGARAAVEGAARSGDAHAAARARRAASRRRPIASASPTTRACPRSTT